MHGLLNTALKTIFLLGLGVSTVGLAADPAMASGSFYYKFSKTTETTHFPTFDPGSEGNFPSICDGQVGYWTQIPMPGGKTFCVLHFTEFFKGGVGSGSGQECVGEVTKYQRQDGPDPVVWSKVVFTKSGACSTHHHHDHDDM